MATAHSELSFHCEKKKKKVKRNQCWYIHPTMCPHYNQCLLAVIRHELRQEVEERKAQRTLHLAEGAD